MTPTPRRLQRTACAAAVLGCALPALATNGMNMEGYGPISTGMGGASQALDHGSAALAQNPATLALMGAGARLDVAVGLLGPRVESRVDTPMGAMASKSDGTSYVMPALGYVRRSGRLVYGLGVFAQGGMGTEYKASSFLAAGSGLPVRSELGVGRVMLPLAYDVTPEFAVGATLDFMWAGLDLRMAAPATQLGGLVTGGSGNLAMGLPQMLPMLPPGAWARIDFSDSSDFTGQANSTGWAAKLGMVYKASPALTLGASYQFESDLGDMKTGSTGASMSIQGMGSIPGRITVVDFQWPSMLAAGAAWQATPALLLAVDVKRIGWADVMKSFRMRFDSAAPAASGFDGSIDFALPQEWKDQTVFNLGLAWAASGQLTLRAGLNLADNPIPDALVNPLFPATVERHYTFGLGWRFDPASELNASLTLAPTTTVTNAMGIEVAHKQRNAQLMYTHRF
ncbi:outer membrane protein transport protein [Azohydromonas sp.]|uniref:OmpP1/FadL family transporter n=1 Tax=Azohydromonas sp. TaxID=1872666 RepID=UPI002C39D630|nr:outer membrane protein transport protein [Azohydromonas sp.]HMM86607.1 outer membrane protein transport protein [Azohydromonas sp.]